MLQQNRWAIHVQKNAVCYYPGRFCLLTLLHWKLGLWLCVLLHWGPSSCFSCCVAAVHDHPSLRWNPTWHLLHYFDCVWGCFDGYRVHHHVFVGWYWFHINCSVSVYFNFHCDAGVGPGGCVQRCTGWVLRWGCRVGTRADAENPHNGKECLIIFSYLCKKNIHINPLFIMQF